MDTLDHPMSESAAEDVHDFSGHWQPALRPDVLAPPASSQPGNHVEIPSDTNSSSNEEHRHRVEQGAETLDTIQEAAAEDTTGNDSSNQLFEGSKSERPSIGLSWSSPPVGLEGFENEEMSSDEDNERLDPAWGITRMDSTQILQTVNRSSSFPTFASQSGPSGFGDVSKVSGSQARTLIHDMESPSSAGSAAGLAQVSATTNGYLQPMPAEQHTAITSQCELQSSGMDDMEQEDDVEARFEEGLPLIPSESNVRRESHDGGNRGGKAHVDELLLAASSEEGNSFFDEVEMIKSSRHANSPRLDRKTTADVLETLDFSPDGPPDSPVRGAITDPIFEDDVASVNRLSTVEESALNPDVVDMWKAALEDEDFLVEDADDLLPDSAPGSPSSFLDPLKDDSASQDRQILDLANKSTPPSYAQIPPKRDLRPEVRRQSSANPYAPHQPSTADLTQLSPSAYGNVGLNRPGLGPMKSYQQHLQQRPAPPQATQSFVDQAKGGYKSPYDLPLELSKSRRRAQAPLPLPAAKGVPPPPRSSSISSEKPLQSPFSPTNTAFPSYPRPAPAQAPPATVPSSSREITKQIISPKKTSSSSSFFEELPMTARARPSTGQGRYTPQQSSSMPPPQLLPRSPPSRQDPQANSHPSPPQPAASDPYAQYQLRPPERLDPYANVTPQAPAVAVPTSTSTRYSPAPGASQLGPRPVPSPRYSPAPPPQSNFASNTSRYASQPALSTQPPQSVIPPPNRFASQPAFNGPPVSALPFQPRTSSPLAYNGKAVSGTVHKSTSSALDSDSSSSYFPSNTILPTGLPGSVSGTSTMPPIRRSQTQSPNARGPIPSFAVLHEHALQRPASVHAQTAESTPFSQLDAVPPPRPNVRQRGLTQTLAFIEPTDGQHLDPLQRWKGSPIFRFGFGGSVVSSFPKHVPRYGAGFGAPMIRPSAGEVTVRTMRDLAPLPDHIANFPGPLRAKSKKKEVLLWMASHIAAMEQVQTANGTIPQYSPDPQKRHEEKILLWKIVRALVEQDGAFGSSADSRKPINTVLSPELFALDETTAIQYRENQENSGIYRPAGAHARSDPVDPVAVESLRKNLLRGDRTKAVWDAVDNRLWAHALLISSTLDRAVWKQVVQEFVRQEVKTVGANTESLAAVYEVFAGNLEESVDELVPPSARAGLQMVNKVDAAAPTKNALDGLDRWRETLSLVLNNRCSDDTQALAALGRLLASYARVEAAHVCYLFSRGPSQPNVFGGADDPQASIVLLGTDHREQSTTLAHDEDALLLTEIYEFATTVLVSSAASSALPHLQVYKLQRAAKLADMGRKAEAQAYCDAIAASLKGTTKVSPYFNLVFCEFLEELSSRLKQAPIQGSSWMAKPSIEKVSGSMWTKFSSFVAGEDSDAESKGSGKDTGGEFAPFAKVTGTPSLSRSGSQSELYGSYPATGAQAIPNTMAGSRYAPNGAQTARSSSELARGRNSFDSQRSPPASSFGQFQRTGSYEPSSLPRQSHMSLGMTSHQSISQSPPTSRYHATPPHTSYTPNDTSPEQNYQRRQPEPYIPTPPPEQIQPPYVPTPPPVLEPQPPPAAHPSLGEYSPANPSLTEYNQPPPEPAYNTNYDPPAQSYGYEPPADTGYVPYQPDPDSDAEDGSQRPQMPKKKSFMDDDEDVPFTSNKSLGSVPAPAPRTELHGHEDDAVARKRANDAATEAAFRAAAEADAARTQTDRDKTLKQKGSWFGGWLGGKKADSLDSASSGSKGPEPKVHRAHLGESKMKLHYDDKLKKWVNPDNPDSMQAKAATPPPPRMGGVGPPGRGLMPSASMPVFSGPLSGPPSRTTTPADMGPGGGLPPALMQRPSSSGLSGPPSGAGTPPPPGSSGALSAGGTGSGMLAAPSRPTTGMSNTGSIDDLLGPASGAAGGRRTIKGKKGAKRYVDVMAQ